MNANTGFTLLVWLIAAFAVGAAVEAGWRLWRNRPAKYYRSIPAELAAPIIVALALFVVIPTRGSSGVVAKSIACAGWITSSGLRIIARQRFTVQPSTHL